MAFRRSVLAAMCAAACSGGGTPGTIEIDQLHAAFVAAKCAQAVRCGVIDDFGACSAIPYTVRVGLVVDDHLIAAVHAGLVRYEPEEAAACIAAMTASCQQADFDSGDSRDCDLVFAGTVPGGGNCKLNAECDSTYCSLPCFPGECCTGQCVTGTAPAPRAGPGELCVNNPSSCVESYCDDMTGVCTPYKTIGGGCVKSEMCEPGSYCDMYTRSCVGPPTRGQKCHDLNFTTCRTADLYCAVDVTCEPFGLTGAPCTKNFECGPDYTCDGTHHCRIGPKLGEPCYGVCIDGSLCDPTTLTCLPAYANDVACTYDGVCASGYCDMARTPSVCADRPFPCF